MLHVTFTIPGRVRGKGRPRFSTRNGKIRTFTDAKTEATEAMIRQFAHAAMKGRPPIEGPVAVHITIFQFPPASWSQKKRESAVYLTGRPDLDNVAKAICDAGNRILYLDDAQISDLHVTRRYSIEMSDRVDVAVREHDGWTERRGLKARRAA